MDTNVAAVPPTEAEQRVLDRLAELHERRVALEAKRETRLKLTPEEQVAIAERALAADTRLDELEQEHGKIGVCIQIVRLDDETDGRAVILKRPNMTVFRRYQDGKNESKDVDNLVRPCVLYPSKAEFDLLVQEKPFLIVRCGNVCSTLAGVRRDDVAAK